MRGKVYSPKPVSRYDGITPAYAGKSHVFNKCCINNWDHPRLCGEKFSAALYAAYSKGSPPPMRGKDCELGKGMLRVRITPAYAGKRIDWNFNPVAYKDHPRLCGEKSS